MFLPATVPDPPVHGDVEGEEADWDVSNSQSRAESPAHDSIKFDLTDVQHAIGCVSDSSTAAPALAQRGLQLALHSVSGASGIVAEWTRRLFEDKLERPQRRQLSNRYLKQSDCCFVLDSPVTAAAGTLQVQAIADVLTMLKSSSCTALDLDACELLFCICSSICDTFVSLPVGAECGCSPTLCIRSFVAVPPQNEFRVFFVAATVIAASQRHIHQFYPHLHRDIDEWNQRIRNFCALLTSKLPLPNCVVDIAFTEQSPNVCCPPHAILLVLTPPQRDSSSIWMLTAATQALYSFHRARLFQPPPLHLLRSMKALRFTSNCECCRATPVCNRLPPCTTVCLSIFRFDMFLLPSVRLVGAASDALTVSTCQNSDLEAAMLQFQSERSQS